MAKRKPWSSSEDQIVKNEITRNPTNLQESFDNASRLLTDRTQKACEARWYTELKYGTAVFYIQSKAIKIPNVKNTLRYGTIIGKTI